MGCETIPVSKNRQKGNPNEITVSLYIPISKQSAMVPESKIAIAPVLLAFGVSWGGAGSDVLRFLGICYVGDFPKLGPFCTFF